MNNLTGQLLGHYHLLEPLGEGGMAIVYKAFDTKNECEVAIKVIRTDNITPKTLDHTIKRFVREIKVLQQLDHPNIVHIIDSGKNDKIPWLAMPLVSGGTLKKYIKRHGKFIWQDAMKLIIPIAEALSYAHTLNVIHRDIKPSNILLTKEKIPMLTDFGIAKILEDEVTMDLTGTSATVGTPEYMAPEQIMSKFIDNRADIYSLGVILYEMVTGRRPYEADTPMAVMVKHASEPLPRPTRFTNDLPISVEHILIKALAKKPEHRYQNMEEFIQSMHAVIENPSISQFEDEENELVTAETGLENDLLTNQEIPPQLPPALPNQIQIAPVRKLTWPYWISGLIVIVALGLILIPKSIKNPHPSPSISFTPDVQITPTVKILTTEPTKTEFEPTTPGIIVPGTMATSTPNKVKDCDVQTFLHVGALTNVSLGGGRNGIRSNPDTTPSDNKIGVAESGEVLVIVGGPVCDHGGYLLWNVEPTINTDWDNGWTPEVAEPIGEYWLSPMPQWNPCKDEKISHLKVSDTAYLSIINNTSNKMRETANLSGKDIGRIKPGESISILDGPVCQDDFIWWKIKNKDGIIGWTVEGTENEFWIIPKIN